MLNAHRLRIHEVPVRMNARGFGRSSIDYPRSAYYMAKVLLAIFVGLFRRRPTPMDDPPTEPTGERWRRRGRGAGARERPRPMSAARAILAAAADSIDGRVQIVAVVVTVLFLASCSSWSAAARLVERYALLWMVLAAPCSCSRSGATCSTWVAEPARASRSRPTRSSSPPRRRLPAAAALLGRDLAAQRGDEDPRPGGRPPRRASCGCERANGAAPDGGDRARQPDVRVGAPSSRTARQYAAGRPRVTASAPAAPR